MIKSRNKLSGKFIEMGSKRFLDKYIRLLTVASNSTYTSKKVNANNSGSFELREAIWDIKNPDDSIECSVTLAVFYQQHDGKEYTVMQKTYRFNHGKQDITTSQMDELYASLERDIILWSTMGKTSSNLTLPDRREPFKIYSLQDLIAKGIE